MASRKSAAAPVDRPLTPKQIAFCDEYLLDLNASKAAVRAGFSAKTASRIGPELLGKPWVQKRINDLVAKRSKRVQLSTDQVLEDLEIIKRHAMSMSENEDGRTIMVNATAALKALELEGKHLKMFTDKVENTGQDGGPINHSITVRFVKP